jgi:hypothetical protein
VHECPTGRAAPRCRCCDRDRCRLVTSRCTASRSFVRGVAMAMRSCARRNGGVRHEAQLAPSGKPPMDRALRRVAGDVHERVAHSARDGSGARIASIAHSIRRHRSQHPSRHPSRARLRRRLPHATSQLRSRSYRAPRHERNMRASRARSTRRARSAPFISTPRSCQRARRRVLPRGARAGTKPDALALAKTRPSLTAHQ